MSQIWGTQNLTTHDLNDLGTAGPLEIQAGAEIWHPLEDIYRYM